MAKVTKQGREKIYDFVEKEIGGRIRENWRGNLTDDQQNLADDIQVFRDDGIIQVGSRNEILKFLEFGTSPHIITPKQADFLVFEWPEAPEEVKTMFSSTFPTVFFKKVEHPGIKPYAHGRKALERVRNEL